MKTTAKRNIHRILRRPPTRAQRRQPSRVPPRSPTRLLVRRTASALAGSLA